MLLTKKDLAERWKVSERTIDQYREDGIIIPVQNLPCIRYNEQYIEKIEGYLPEKTTLRERNLEKQLEEITKERDYYKSVILEMHTLIIKTEVERKAVS